MTSARIGVGTSIDPVNKIVSGIVIERDKSYVMRLKVISVILNVASISNE